MLGHLAKRRETNRVHRVWLSKYCRIPRMGLRRLLGQSKRVCRSCKDQSIVGKSEAYMFIVLFAILLLAWLGGFLVFHVSSVLIHILLLFAVLSLIGHLFQRRSVL
jgi:hypothetical protein